MLRRRTKTHDSRRSAINERIQGPEPCGSSDDSLAELAVQTTRLLRSAARHAPCSVIQSRFEFLSGSTGKGAALNQHEGEVVEPATAVALRPHRSRFSALRRKSSSPALSRSEAERSFGGSAKPWFAFAASAKFPGRTSCASPQLIKGCGPISDLVANATRVTEGTLVGDAACFIDPVFSSGMHLTTYPGLLAARSTSICRARTSSLGSAIDGGIEMVVGSLLAHCATVLVGAFLHLAACLQWRLPKLATKPRPVPPDRPRAKGSN
jgi:hypothetical protein